jgi:hypothetical protein
LANVVRVHILRSPQPTPFADSRLMPLDETLPSDLIVGILQEGKKRTSCPRFSVHDVTPSAPLLYLLTSSLSRSIDPGVSSHVVPGRHSQNSFSRKNGRRVPPGDHGPVSNSTNPSAQSNASVQIFLTRIFGWREIQLCEAFRLRFRGLSVQVPSVTPLTNRQKSRFSA